MVLLDQIGWKPKDNIHKAKFAVAKQQWRKAINLGFMLIPFEFDKSAIISDNDLLPLKHGLQAVAGLRL